MITNNYNTFCLNEQTRHFRHRVSKQIKSQIKSITQRSTSSHTTTQVSSDQIDR
jgi:hypothetical protein